MWKKMPILWKNRECLFSEMRFFDEFFDVINGDPFLTLYKTSALVTVSEGTIFMHFFLISSSHQLIVTGNPVWVSGLDRKLKIDGHVRPDRIKSKNPTNASEEKEKNFLEVPSFRKLDVMKSVHVFIYITW